MDIDEAALREKSLQDLDSILRPKPESDPLQPLVRANIRSEWTAGTQGAFSQAIAGPMTPQAQASRQVNSGVINGVQHKTKY